MNQVSQVIYNAHYCSQVNDNHMQKDLSVTWFYSCVSDFCMFPQSDCKWQPVLRSTPYVMNAVVVCFACHHHFLLFAFPSIVMEYCGVHCANYTVLSASDSMRVCFTIS